MTGADLRGQRCFTSAVAALGQFRAGTLTPLELFESMGEGTPAVEPTVNAFTATYFDDVRPALERAGETYRRRPDAARPLEGLVLAVKELTAVGGQQHTLGTRALRDNVAVDTEPAIQRALDSGA